MLVNKLVAAGTSFILVAVGAVFFVDSVRSTPAQADAVADPETLVDPLVESQVGEAEAPLNTVGDLADIKNVVFVLVDDLDWNLFNQIPRLTALKDQGITFTNQTVTDSLCCPSRVSIMRGEIHENRVQLLPSSRERLTPAANAAPMA